MDTSETIVSNCNRLLMTNGCNGVNSEPYLMITEEPKQHGYRFRYESEGKSHGIIQGVNSRKGHKSFPSVSIVNYKGPAKIVVYLVSDDETPRLHAHKLVGDKCEDGQCTVELDGKGFMTASFANLTIMHATKKDVVGILASKIMDSMQATQQYQLSEEDKQKATQHAADQAKTLKMNAVRLCFQAYLKLQGQYIQLPSVVSQPIYNNKKESPLKICRMDRQAGSCVGGDEVFLLCEKVSHNDIKVRFFQEDERGDLSWEGYGEFGPHDVHRSFAIVFRTPSYANTELAKEVVVQMELLRPSDNETSEPKPFTFYASQINHDDISRKKMKRVPFLGGSDDHAVFAPSPSPAGSRSGTSTQNSRGGKRSRSQRNPSGKQQMLQSPNLPKSDELDLVEDCSLIDNRHEKTTRVSMPDINFSVNQPMFSQKVKAVQQRQFAVAPRRFATSSSVAGHQEVESFNIKQTSTIGYSGLMLQQAQGVFSGQQQPIHGSVQKMTTGQFSLPDDRDQMLYSAATTRPLQKPSARQVNFDGQQQGSSDVLLSTLYSPASLHTFSSSENFIGQPPVQMLQSTENNVTNNLVDSESWQNKQVVFLNPNNSSSTTVPYTGNFLVPKGLPEQEVAECPNPLPGGYDVALRIAERTAEALQNYAVSGDVKEVLSPQRHLVAIQDDEGDTTLHQAIIHGQMNALRNLVSAACTLPSWSSLVNGYNHQKQTPLHLAVMTGLHEAIDLLIMFEAKTSIIDRHGNTPFHLAAKAGNAVALKKLLTGDRARRVPGNGVLDILNHEGYAAVHLASRACSLNCLKLLHVFGADMSLADNRSGRTPLHVAVETKDLSVTGYLILEAFVDVNAPTLNGDTPLHYACGMGHVGLTALLVAANSDPKVTNFEKKPDSDEGHTPFDLARDNDKLIRVLRGDSFHASLKSKKDSDDTESDEGVSLKSSADSLGDMSLLDHTTRCEIGKLLDHCERGKDWVALADAMGLKDLVSLFRLSSLGDNSGPTVQLLNAYEVYDGTIERLCNLLVEMGHVNIVRIIRARVCGKMKPRQSFPIQQLKDASGDEEHLESGIGSLSIQ